MKTSISSFHFLKTLKNDFEHYFDKILFSPGSVG